MKDKNNHLQKSFYTDLIENKSPAMLLLQEVPSTILGPNWELVKNCIK